MSVRFGLGEADARRRRELNVGPVPEVGGSQSAGLRKEAGEKSKRERDGQELVNVDEREDVVLHPSHPGSATVFSGERWMRRTSCSLSDMYALFFWEGGVMVCRRRAKGKEGRSLCWVERTHTYTPGPHPHSTLSRSRTSSKVKEIEKQRSRIVERKAVLPRGSPSTQSLDRAHIAPPPRQIPSHTSKEHTNPPSTTFIQPSTFSLSLC